MPRYITTEPPLRVFGRGASGTAELREIFYASPLYDGSYTDARMREVYTSITFPDDGNISDGGAYFGVVNRYYRGAPDLSTVRTGGGGLPATPYCPNPASPDSSLSPASIPALSTPPSRGGGGAFQGDGTLSPHTTSERIARQRLGRLMLGRSGAP